LIFYALCGRVAGNPQTLSVMQGSEQQESGYKSK
jgi:hypothetical protein